jgi:hypothetical protein
MKTILHYDAGARLMARLAAPLPDAEVLLFRVV